MREIKFRAWDKELKTMHYDDDENLPDFIECFYVEGCALMQYIGLKDKNGTEIYEGDIIKCVSELLANYGTMRTGKYQTKFLEVVSSEENSYSFGTRKIGSQYISSPILRVISDNYFEVIGNIYQNPELLVEASNDN